MHKAIIVTDLGYGDSGKGTIVDFLVRKYDAHTVVKHNGGAQAAHNVVLPSGKNHIFHQFGSGTFFGAKTIISRYALFDPRALFVEAEDLKQHDIRNPLTLISVDEKAIVVTAFHKILNRLREVIRGDSCHGSCGMGIGETMRDVLQFPNETIYAKDLLNKEILNRKLHSICARKWMEARELGLKNHPDFVKYFADHEIVDNISNHFLDVGSRIKILPTNELYKDFTDGTVIFEGSQGVLLDEWHGFFPYNTWSTTTRRNADFILNEMNFRGEVQNIGVIRAYMTRHGAGPLVTRDYVLEESLPDKHNTFNTWQHMFKVGWLDYVALRYALKVNNSINSLAVTNIDRLDKIQNLQVCNSYEDNKEIDYIMPQEHENLLSRIEKEITNKLLQIQPVYTSIKHKDIIEDIEQKLNVKVGLLSQGPTYMDKIWINN